TLGFAGRSGKMVLDRRLDRRRGHARRASFYAEALRYYIARGLGPEVREFQGSGEHEKRLKIAWDRRKRLRFTEAPRILFVAHLPKVEGVPRPSSTRWRPCTFQIRASRSLKHE